MKTGAARFDVVVLGAGAAGMMCAFEAGRRGRRVLLLEHGEQVGRKILISGGGRCNFTNLHARAENFLSGNPHFAKSALARYGPKDFLALVERHGIRYHEKTLGQMFCDGSARQIVAMLEGECAQAGVETRCGVKVVAVLSHPSALPPQRTKIGRRGAPVVAYAWGTQFRAEVCGGDERGRDPVRDGRGGDGRAVDSEDGATGFGYDVARRFGLGVVEPRPGLVPLVLGAEDRERWCDLAGVATEVVASSVAEIGRLGASPLRLTVELSGLHPSEQVRSPEAPRSGRDDRLGRERPLGRRRDAPEFREGLLVTHRGLSGPAVLQVSSYWRPGGEVSFDLAPGREVLAGLLQKNARRDPAGLARALRGVLPARMVERWVALQVGGGKPDWTNAGIARMERNLHAWTLRPDGSEGFAKAEVTAGGVDTDELDARTMQSKRVAGLYFIGEVVDVTGWLGGYNFQWAWASAVAAGAAV